MKDLMTLKVSLVKTCPVMIQTLYGMLAAPYQGSCLMTIVSFCKITLTLRYFVTERQKFRSFEFRKSCCKIFYVKLHRAALVLVQRLDRLIY